MADNFQGFWDPPGSGDDGPTYPKHALQSDAGSSLDCEGPMLTEFQIRQHQAALSTVMGSFLTPQTNISNSGINPLLAPPHTPASASTAAELGLGQYQHRSPPKLPAPTGYLGHGVGSAFPTANSPTGSWPAMAYPALQQLPPNDLNDTHAYKASSSPEPRDSHGAPDKPHRRGYQACQNCRSRKVKCDLGSKRRKPGIFVMSLTTWSFRCRCPDRASMQAVPA